MLKHFLFALALFLPCIHGLIRPGGVGRLPALGWNSWNAYRCGVDAEKIIETANVIVDKGFKDAGYLYVNSDDCWSNITGRDNTTHLLQPNMTKFPEGIKGVTEKIHSMGLKFGIYSSAGTLTCGGYPASLGYEEVDAATFASWGVDYLKYDNCHVPVYWTDSCYSCIPDTTFGKDFVNGTCTKDSGEFRLCNYFWPTDGVNYTASYTALRYRIMQNALEAQNRTILYSLCEWGTNEPWTWANKTGNSWRTTDDIAPYWSRVAEIRMYLCVSVRGIVANKMAKVNMNSFLAKWNGFTGHNDPDLLAVGNGNLTLEECRSHFALWAIMKAPLLISTNLLNLSEPHIEILQNKYLLAFNQDPVYGEPAQPYKWGINPDWTFNATNPAEYWSGSFSNGTIVAMLNTLIDTRKMTASFSEIPELTGGSSYEVIDGWTGKSMGCQKGSVDVQLEGHDTAVLILGSSETTLCISFRDLFEDAE